MFVVSKINKCLHITQTVYFYLTFNRLHELNKCMRSENNVCCSFWIQNFDGETICNHNYKQLLTLCWYSLNIAYGNNYAYWTLDRKRLKRVGDSLQFMGYWINIYIYIYKIHWGFQYLLQNTYILSKLHNLYTYECSLVANHIHTYFSKTFCSLLYLVSLFQSWAMKLPIY